MVTRAAGCDAAQRATCFDLAAGLRGPFPPDIRTRPEWRRFHPRQHMFLDAHGLRVVPSVFLLLRRRSPLLVTTPSAMSVSPRICALVAAAPYAALALLQAR